MTEEQIKRKAELNLNDLDDKGFDFDEWSITDAYTNGAVFGAEIATKELQEGLKVAETLNKSLNVMNKELEADRDKYRNMVFDLQEQIEKMYKLLCDSKCCASCKYLDTEERCEGCGRLFENWELAE